MRRTGIMLAAAIAVLAAACSSTPELTDIQEDAFNLDPESPVTATEVDNVWIFSHEPDAFNEALHGGEAEIRDGCLYVDNTIVVWHVDDVPAAEELIANVDAGTAEGLLIPGGGVSLDEGASAIQIPKVIRDRCSTSAVWYAAPLSTLP
ncbi:MAG: hypothetical protein ACR2N2_01045 [Acidimicrobiia bacterium]